MVIPSGIVKLSQIVRRIVLDGQYRTSGRILHRLVIVVTFHVAGTLAVNFLTTFVIIPTALVADELRISQRMGENACVKRNSEKINTNLIR
jgi:hypothetical protein